MAWAGRYPGFGDNSKNNLPGDFRILPENRILQFSEFHRVYRQTNRYDEENNI